MKSVIGSFYTLSACIDKIPNMKVDEWKTYNNNQQKYLEIYKNCRNAKIPEIESKVSVGDVAPVNNFLKQRGFDIQLDQIGPLDLAIASIFEIFLKWITKGKPATIYHKENSGNVAYKGVKLSSGVIVKYFKDFVNPVAVIETQNGDTVYMTIPTSAPTDSFETFEMARKLIAETGRYAQDYEDLVIFPKVDLDIQPDISWILGMSDELQAKWMISQAMQQTKVKMDEEGVVIKEAFAISARLMCCSFDTKKRLIIDEPFLFVVKRFGLKEPLFSAYLNTDGWIKTT